MLAASLLLFLLFELLPGDVALSELGPYSTPEQRQRLGRGPCLLLLGLKLPVSMQ